MRTQADSAMWTAMRMRTWMMAILVLAGCQDGARQAPDSARSVAPAPQPGASARPPAAPAAPDARSPEAARAIVERYFAQLAAGETEAADKQWEHAKQAREARLKLGQVTSARVDAPGRTEGAAGSIYVEIPAHLMTQANGKPQARDVRVTLRRVNDVPGSTVEQRHWHLYRIEVDAQDAGRVSIPK